MSYKINKNLYNREEAMDKIIFGMKQVHDKVALTTGAMGKWIIIENELGLPKIINDGVSITKDIWLGDKLENLGAQLIVSSAEKTASIVGDNTSMTTIMTYHIANEGWEVLKQNQNFRAIHFVNGIKYQANEFLKKLIEHRVEVTTPQELFDVAYIASRDEEISSLIVEAIVKTGDEGVIHITKSPKDNNYLEFIEGMKLNNGIVNPKLFLDQTNMVSVMENTHVVLVNDNITRGMQLHKLINMLLKEEGSKKKVLIFGNHFTSEVVSSVVGFNNKSSLDVQLVFTPGVSEQDKLNYLMDIQTLTSGKIFQIHNGDKLENASISDLGVLDKVLITYNETSLFIEKNEDIKFRIEKRVEYLKTLLEDKEVTNTDLKRAIIKERIAKLTSGVALIRIYEPTNEALNDKWERTDDALRSAKAAIQEGLLPGGAISLRDVVRELRTDFNSDGQEEEFIKGRDVFLNSMLKPFIQILINAEFKIGEINEFINLDKGIGVNVFNNNIGNMMEQGVIDTFLGARMSIVNAVSTSTMLLRSGGAITIQEK